MNLSFLSIKPIIRLNRKIVKNALHSSWEGILSSFGEKEPGLRQAIFTIEQLEMHARNLAHIEQSTVKKDECEPLTTRLEESEALIATCHNLMSRRLSSIHAELPAVEWLLDNHYLIEEQVYTTLKHFPKGFSRTLPRVVGIHENCAALRIFNLMNAYVAHSDGIIDAESLNKVTVAFQEVSHLTLGELWAVPIMLRIGILEKLRNVVVSVAWQLAHRDRANEWSRKISETKTNHEHSLLMLADLVRQSPTMANSFVSQLFQELQKMPWPASSLALNWLEHRIVEQGKNIEDTIRNENSRQNADKATMANCIVSLRFLNSYDWKQFVENHSFVELLLRKDPAGIYPGMDFRTRNDFRERAEKLSRKFKVNEEVVLEKTLELCINSKLNKNENSLQSHVGYYLLDNGLPELQNAIEKRTQKKFKLNSLRANYNQLIENNKTEKLKPTSLFFYLIPWIAFILFIPFLHFSFVKNYSHSWIIYLIFICIASSQFSLAIVNWLVTHIRKPNILARMDFEKEIPDNCKTCIVVPTLLCFPAQIQSILDGLELRYLCNRNSNLSFGLLTDFGDSQTENASTDDTFLELASLGIENLNQKYFSKEKGLFFLFHRPRIFNHQENTWMGHERKRGKIEDFNAYLLGDDRKNFSCIVGSPSSYQGIVFVITLDADTHLPWGAAWKLIGTAAHPLNSPELELSSGFVRLKRGYAILQPRIGISHASAKKTCYSDLMAGDVGLDPYTQATSDIYQDLFSEASFIGKGIYNLKAFSALLDRKFPDNTVLSHDLLESCFARTGQCSDIELSEDAPSSYLTDLKRHHRWMRGDWQIAPWLIRRRSSASASIDVSLNIGALGWWKIFDNLRRAFVAPSFVCLFEWTWFEFGNQAFPQLLVFTIFALPEFLPLVIEASVRTEKLPLWIHAKNVLESTERKIFKCLLDISFLPVEAQNALDAAVRSLWRMLFSKKHLLEWQTAADVGHTSTSNFSAFLKRMWISPLLGTITLLALLLDNRLFALSFAAPILWLWIASPLVAWRLSQPLKPKNEPITVQEKDFLRRVARLTWRYFEEFQTAKENSLPPDNFQTYPNDRIAQRTSPTNIGLGLLSHLTAWDLNYLSTGKFLDKLQQITQSMNRLDRYEGHFLNWYDTKTCQTMKPLYVSTVDSGNLIGHLRVVKVAIMDFLTGPLLQQNIGTGLNDTALFIFEILDKSEHKFNNSQFDIFVRDIKKLISQFTDNPRENKILLNKMIEQIQNFPYFGQKDIESDTLFWSNALQNQATGFVNEIDLFFPWIGEINYNYNPEIVQNLSKIESSNSINEYLKNLQLFSDLLFSQKQFSNEDNLRLLVSNSLEKVRSRVALIEALNQICGEFCTANFRFLYDANRKLFSIGYNVDEHRLDNNYYDLLASEARLASFISIAEGQLPFEHWFSLGRRLTTAAGNQVLLSWSGSMFEYLMPLLVMPTFEGTLLHQSCVAAVKRQIAYGHQRGIPWGISESCFSLKDAEGTYQYHAFGVPGLGLQRGLSLDLVVSPYSSALALLIEPKKSIQNLKKMASSFFIGKYGYFEAVDYTTSRLTESNSNHEKIKCYMAHHQGMSLVSFAHAILGDKMQVRFLKNPDFRAAALLLQERIPSGNILAHPYAQEAKISSQASNQNPSAETRVISNPNSPIPQIHLLSNGKYHVGISAAGGGFTRWNGSAITRWREDLNSESFGIFFFVQDNLNAKRWSNTFQPTLRFGLHQHAIFSPGLAEFRRVDELLETHTEIAVAAEDDLEVRRMTLSNRSSELRDITITSYAEIVLAHGLSDEVHPAFSNLFIDSEILEGSNVVLITRRPRSATEKPLWAFCFLQTNDSNSNLCSVSLDRTHCLGRGRKARLPAFLENSLPFARIEGTNLDPCVAFRKNLIIEAHDSVQIELVLGIAENRSAAIALVRKYSDRHMTNRVFQMAATNSRTIGGYLDATAAEVSTFEKLAAAILFPLETFRASPRILKSNRKSQSWLWRQGISGDLPMVLLRLIGNENIELVKSLLRGHAFLRSRGIIFDLILWNDDHSGYRRVLHDQIMQIISSSHDSQNIDKPGGIFLKEAEHFGEDDRILLQAASRVSLKDSDGSLENQLEKFAILAMREKPIKLKSLKSHKKNKWNEFNRAEIHNQFKYQAEPDLSFWNGLGGFSKNGREYKILLNQKTRPAAPWVNVMANPNFGTVVSEQGSAYTWFENSQRFRLTPWSNDVAKDPNGESIFIRDELSGGFFSVSGSSGASEKSYLCTHGIGYSVFDHQEMNLKTTLTTFVAPQAPLKYFIVKIQNTGSDSRHLSLFGCVEWVLGDIKSKHSGHVVTEIEPLTGAVLARNCFNSDFSEVVAFFDCSEVKRSVTGDRSEYLGRNGDPSHPAALRQRLLSDRVGPGLDACAAIQTVFELAQGEEKVIVFLLGAGKNLAEATHLVQTSRGVEAANLSLQHLNRTWAAKTEALTFQTPDKSMDILLNSWLPYQILSCRLWGRTGFYQSGGAFGFRDQLQDCMAILHHSPNLAREHIIRASGRQFIEGDVQHWWHPPTGHGVRTLCSDDYLWLPYVVARYVNVTGDVSVLNETTRFIVGRKLRNDEESYYDLPADSESSATVFEHCKKAIVFGFKYGSRGLPLIGCGDWNDGMNRVGHEGKGESVWLGFFMVDVLKEFAAIASSQGDNNFYDLCIENRNQIQQNLEKYAWDGQWYMRAFFDNGTPLGSHLNDECQIDSLPQSWATISETGDMTRRQQALDCLWEKLVDEKLKIVKLFTPSFDKSELDPGYIKGYPPGVRENGGQYTHAAVWAAWAFAVAGQTERANKIAQFLNPIEHSQNMSDSQKYKVEPYVLAADIYGQDKLAGCGGWTWYTGASSWYYRLLTENILGIEKKGNRLHFNPRVPLEWSTYQAHYQFGKAKYSITFKRSQTPIPKSQVIEDGLAPDDNLLLIDDAKIHMVTVWF